MRSATYLSLAGILALGLMAAPHDAEATIVWTFTNEFSGSGDTLSGPVVVTVDDGGSEGSVDVTIDTTGLNGSLSEFVDALYLNVTDSTSLPLGFTFDGGTVDPVSVSQSRDDTDHKADGDGFFDIVITWDPNTLIAGLMDTITFTLAGLVEESFFALSSSENFDGTAQAGDAGSFHAALKAQGLGADGAGSGWFSPSGGFVPGDETLVPEPGSLALFGFGLVGLGLAICRRRARSL